MKLALLPAASQQNTEQGYVITGEQAEAEACIPYRHASITYLPYSHENINIIKMHKIITRNPYLNILKNTREIPATNRSTAHVSLTT